MVVAKAVAMTACSNGARTAPPERARLLAAVSPQPSGCDVATSCAPAAAHGVAIAALPQGFGGGGVTSVDQLDVDDVMLSRTWQVSKPSFLNPGGEPMGPTINVQVTNHPSEDEATALGLASNPRPPSPVQLGVRGAYASTWTVSTYALDGTTPVQLQAVSIYVAVSDTVRVQINTLGLGVDLAQLVADAVVVQ